MKYKQNVKIYNVMASSDDQLILELPDYLHMCLKNKIYIFENHF